MPRFKFLNMCVHAWTAFDLVSQVWANHMALLYRSGSIPWPSVTSLAQSYGDTNFCTYVRFRKIAQSFTLHHERARA